MAECDVRLKMNAVEISQEESFELNGYGALCLWTWKVRENRIGSNSVQVSSV